MGNFWKNKHVYIRQVFVLRYELFVFSKSENRQDNSVVRDNDAQLEVDAFFYWIIVVYHLWKDGKNLLLQSMRNNKPYFISFFRFLFFLSLSARSANQTYIISSI